MLPPHAGCCATATALALTACSGGGAAKTQESSSTGGGGGGDSSGYTIAMVTHETPGDNFWDKIKAGANQAAKKVNGIATTLATPDAPSLSGPDATPPGTRSPRTGELPSARSAAKRERLG